MSARSKKTGLLSALLFLAGAAIAAPDEGTLVTQHCRREQVTEPKCIVDYYSRMDEVYAARGVELVPAAVEIDDALRLADLLARVMPLDEDRLIRGGESRP